MCITTSRAGGEWSHLHDSGEGEISSENPYKIRVKSNWPCKIKNRTKTHRWVRLGGNKSVDVRCVRACVFTHVCARVRACLCTCRVCESVHAPGGRVHVGIYAHVYMHAGNGGVMHVCWEKIKPGHTLLLLRHGLSCKSSPTRNKVLWVLFSRLLKSELQTGVYGEQGLMNFVWTKEKYQQL